MLGTHIKYVETRSGSKIPVKVVLGDRNKALFWDQCVQPYVRKMDRADKNWNWARMCSWLPPLEMLNGRNTLFLQLLTRRQNGESFPIGQVFLSLRYPFVPEEGRECAFLWFLCSTPRSALQDFGIPADIKLARPLVDMAIQASYQLNLTGRILLHAVRTNDPLWNQKLFDIYHRECLLLQFPRRFIFRFVFTRRNDDRLFFADEQHAINLSRDLNYLR